MTIITSMPKMISLTLKGHHECYQLQHQNILYGIIHLKIIAILELSEPTMYVC
jgi:hypothetical protein